MRAAKRSGPDQIVHQQSLRRISKTALGPQFASGVSLVKIIIMFFITVVVLDS